ncbi:MAG TPA: DUF456 domain-containing protein [Isosphaeraceae bacterium]|nr:DUF456 domain-containing protein [Isosphaeraceae bacterium]
MAGYRETFAGNVDYAYRRGSHDIAGNLQRGISSLANGASGFSKITGEARNAQRGIQDLSNRMGQLRNDIASATDPAQIRRLTREFEHARKAADGLSRKLRQMPFDALQKGLGKVTKGLISMNTSILTIGFDFLIDSIKRVYELQERWTKAIGGFNMRIGGMTAGLKGAQKAATQWSSTIRGLTDGDINEGIQMFADFTDAIGRVVEKGDDFAKFGIQLARGFNLGGAGAGKLTKVFENLGNDSSSAAETIKAMVKGANAAHVPTNLLAKDILDSSTYMARFGKEGQKTFVTGAAWVRKYTISMEQLRNSVEGLDMFDEAAKTASKLNATFGTMINSMDLMMEDDPAKRLEMIRQQFLAQGTTFEKLTPKQRRYLSETLKLTEDQTAALLSSKNAGQSYADFQEKAAKKEKQELSAKQLMQKQLQATAQTMYAFGAAFDRVTLAIANAIKPLLKVLGLASDGDKKFTSFGQVMESITKTVEQFFNSLAKNDKWNDFMKELARDLQKAGAALKDFVLDGRAADLVGDIAAGMKQFYVTVRDLAVKAAPALRPLMNAFLFLSRHLKEIAIAWAGMKGFNAINGMMGGGLLGKIGGSMLGRAGVAGAAGYAIGGKGAGIGSAVGSIAGSFLGPIGMVLGPIVGGFIGKGIEKLLSSKKYKTKVEQAEEELADTIKKEQATRAGYESQVESFTARQKADDVLRRSRREMLKSLEKQAMASKGKEITLTKEQAMSLSEHASELTMFAKSTAVTKQMVEALGGGSKLTATQLDALISGASDYETTLGKLRDTSEQILKQQQAQLDVSSLGTQKTVLEALQKNNAAEITSQQAYLKTRGVNFDPSKIDEKLEGMLDAFDDAQRYQNDSDFRSQANNTSMGPRIRAYIKDLGKMAPEERKKLEAESIIRKKQLENVENEKKLQTLQTNFIKQQSIIQLRALEMGSGRFLEFTKAHPELKDPGAAFSAYLVSNKESLSGLYGQSGYDLLSQVPKFATGGVVTRPTVAMVGEAGPEAIIPLRSRNFAGGHGGDDGVRIVTQIADVHIDGQKAGRAVVKTMITGRN